MIHDVLAAESLVIKCWPICSVDSLTIAKTCFTLCTPVNWRSITRCDHKVHVCDLDIDLSVRSRCLGSWACIVLRRGVLINVH